MKGKKGFTLIELMVVILIVAILAAVAIPMLRARIDRAKWSEANASCGTIWTAVRAYVAEKGPDYDYGAETWGGLDDPTVMERLGFYADDLSGTYFAQVDYVLSGVTGDPPGCTVTVGPGTMDLSPPGIGTFIATPGSVTWTIGAAP